MKNVNIAHREVLSATDKFAMKLTEKVGTMGFFWIIFWWTVIWLVWNTIAPKSLSFDPFPGFVLWLFISNMIQIFLMPLLLVGQNLQNKHAEIQANNDYEVNVKAEEEIQLILQKLDAIEKKLGKQNA